MIPLTNPEVRWRDELLATLIPSPIAGLPAMADLDLVVFWATFQRTAPIHLKLGFRASVVGVGAVLPYLLGYRGTLPRLTPDQRDDVVQRAKQLPGFGMLVEVGKLVACLAYFADPAVEAAARGRQ